MPPLALWIPYAAAIMILAAALAWLVERFARTLRRATRFGWIAALIVSPIIAVIAHDNDAPRIVSHLTQAGSRVDAASVRTANGDGVANRAYAIPPAAIQFLQMLEQPLRNAWAIVSGIMMALLAITVLRLRRQTGNAVMSMVDGIAVRVDDTLGPAASPFRGGAVIVPSWVETLDAPLRRLVLMHETEHLKAADPAMLLGSALIVALLPWSPAAWWMFRRLRLAVEIDCDARTLVASGEGNACDRSLYARLLILAAQRSSAAARPIGSSVVVPAVSSHLARRLHMLTGPATRLTRSRVLALTTATLAIATLAIALPRPQRVTHVGEQPAEIVGLYWMMTPDMPSEKMLAPGREFTYLRLLADGRSRLENVTVDARGEQVAPSVEVGPWSTEKWQVQPASGGVGAKLCWQLGENLLCSAYARDAKSGDITIYRDFVGGKVELVLQRASGR